MPAAARAQAATPAVRRLVTVLLWLAAAAVAGWLLVYHALHEPSGRGYDDSYIYLSSASDFIAHPGQLYEAAHAQIASAYAQFAFLHPPSGLLPYLLFVPLERTAGLPAAAAAWTALDALALCAGVLLFARMVGLTRMQIGGALLLMSFSNPVFSEIGQGQINGIVLLLIAIAVVRMPRLDSGFFMALALGVKPVAGLILLVPLLRGQPRITLVALASLAVLNVPFLPLIGIGSAFYYIGTVLPYFAAFPLRNNSNTALPFVLQMVFGPPLPRNAPLRATVPQAIVALLVLWGARISVALLWLRSALDRRSTIVLPIVVAMATVPFLSSTIWPHYLIFVFPLALRLIASNRAWFRAGGWLTLIALQWRGPVQGLWIGISILWLAAAALVITDTSWRWPRALAWRRPALPAA